MQFSHKYRFVRWHFVWCFEISHPFLELADPGIQAKTNMRLNRPTAMSKLIFARHMSVRTRAHFDARISDVICRAACQCGAHSVKGHSTHQNTCEISISTDARMHAITTFACRLVPRTHIHDLDGRLQTVCQKTCRSKCRLFRLYTLSEQTYIFLDFFFGLFAWTSWLAWQGARISGR